MSNSLLMNLMIERLLSENPTLKKSLIKESPEYKRKDAGTHRALTQPNQHKALSSSELKSIKEPLKGGLVSALKKIGLAVGGTAITLAMLAIANFHDTENSTVSLENYDTVQAVEKIIEKSPEKDETLSDQIVYTLGEILPDVEDRAKDFIIGHEGTKDIPYQDEGQISGGHGTSIFDRGNIEKILKKPKVNRKFKIKGKTSSRKIPFWQNHMYNKYKISDDIAFSNTRDYPGKIGPEVGRVIFGKKYEEIKKNFTKTSDYLYVFPENIQIALLDLSYNMGPYFTKKFKQFDENMNYAAEAILNSEFNMANNFLRSAADALENNIKEIKDSESDVFTYTTTKTKYYKDLSRRANNVIDLFNQGVSVFPEVISPPDKRYKMENKKYSLKNIFFS